MTPDPSSPAIALPAPLGAVVPAERARPDMRLLGLLALGHMVIDINQGSLPAILPIVKDALNLSYAATGVICSIPASTSRCTPKARNNSMWSLLPVRITTTRQLSRCRPPVQHLLAAPFVDKATT